MNNFKNMKFRVNSPEHSKQIQELLFELGYSWGSVGKFTIHINQPYLYTFTSGYIFDGQTESYFKARSECKECDLGELASVVFWKQLLDFEDSQRNKVRWNPSKECIDKLVELYSTPPRHLKAKPYPKVMLVSDDKDFKHAFTRVVFMEKNGKFIAWHSAETIEEAEKHVSTNYWKYAKDIEEEPIVELSVAEIAEKLNIPSDKLRIKE
jgi:hypothetical protein